eukprot:scaffold183987_cov39-Prasinocladus_malaysianus.AAC.1
MPCRHSISVDDIAIYAANFLLHSSREDIEALETTAKAMPGKQWNRRISKINWAHSPNGSQSQEFNHILYDMLLETSNVKVMEARRGTNKAESSKVRLHRAVAKWRKSEKSRSADI